MVLFHSRALELVYRLASCVSLGKSLSAQMVFPMSMEGPNDEIWKMALGTICGVQSLVVENSLTPWR